MNETENMGGIIRRLRISCDWTQEELADRLHVSAQAVSKWETGQSLPDISQVPLLARIFGVNTDILFGIESREPDFPKADADETNPEAAWNVWQKMRKRIADCSGIDLCVWNYVYAGYRLCCPASLTFHAGHAQEVLTETLRFAETHAKQMEKSANYLRESFISLMTQLYALSGNETNAKRLAQRAPAYPSYNTLTEHAALCRTMGLQAEAATWLNTAGTAVSNLLIDTAAECAENALALGQTADALDAANFGIALIGLLGGAVSHRRDGDCLLQLGARALLRQGKKEEALQWLKELVDWEERRMQPGQQLVVKRAFFSGSVLRWQSENRQNLRFLRAILLRELDHPELAALREEPAFQKLRDRVLIMTEGAAG